MAVAVYKTDREDEDLLFVGPVSSRSVAVEFAVSAKSAAAAVEGTRLRVFLRLLFARALEPFVHSLVFVFPNLWPLPFVVEKVAAIFVLPFDEKLGGALVLASGSRFAAGLGVFCFPAHQPPSTFCLVAQRRLGLLSENLATFL